MKKNILFLKIFRGMPTFLKFLCLVDDFRISNVYQSFFTLNILFDEVDRGLGHEKNIFLDTI